MELVGFSSLLLSLGANDVANAFATSVGAKAISMRNAMIFAGIFEFLGAFLMGSNVTETIQSKICDPHAFDDEPEMLMFGMACVLVGVAVWLILATLYSLPVSTTHSCIGGLVGMTLIAKGVKAVKWLEIIKVIISWFVSPVLSGLISALLFYIVRTFILRHTNCFDRAFTFYPILVGFTLFVLTMFLLLNGIPIFKGSVTPWLAIVIGVAVGIVVALIVYFTIVPCLKKRISKQRKDDEEAVNSSTTVDIEIQASEKKEIELPVIQATEDEKKPEDEKTPEGSEIKETEEKTEVKKDISKKVEHNNIHAELSDEQSKVYQIHQRAEKFDPYTEKVFGYLQVITAILNAFAHGANDVSNAIGPLASCIAIYKAGGIPDKGSAEAWILVLGGVGIVVGLAVLGYKVMAAIGVNMVTVTPSRGFAIEIGGAFVIVTGSQLGLPLSTTHCQVGSTVAVGMMEGKESVNWSLVGQIIVGWGITLIVCGCTAAALYAFGTFSPSRF